MGSGIIHILAVESHDVVKHPLGLNSGAVWIQFDSLNITVDGFMPLASFTGLIAFQIILLSGSKLFTFHYSLFTIHL